MTNNCNTDTVGNACLPGLAQNPSACKPWSIPAQSKTNCLVNAYQQESLQIAGATINVYKLLGLYEQSLLLDLTGNGAAISGGDQPNFPASHAFTKIATQWISKQAGPEVAVSAYIGYDFGVLKVATGRARYGDGIKTDPSVRYKIATIQIKQGSKSENRATKVRVERSENGVDWYGVAILDLPDNDELNTFNFKQTVPNRYWRIRPLAFNGKHCDCWMVQAFKMDEMDVTKLIQFDPILMEARDRNYATSPAELKGFYDLVSPNTDLTRFGFELPSVTYQIKINFDTCVALLGRPIIIGDILELPSETQYTPNLTPIKKYLEVTDTTWDGSTYTPGWQPTMLLITGLNALASQETQDIFGTMPAFTDTSGLFNTDDGNSMSWQDLSDMSQNINQIAYNDLPERGNDAVNVIRTLEEDTIAKAAALNIPIGKIGLKTTDLYIESAIPPNHAPYTEDVAFPDHPKDGDYHRMVYEGLSKDVPARLYRYSGTKGRWVYLETDRRQQYNGQKALLQEYTTSTHSVPPKDIK